jgi:calcineurin-like phosphoesterase family protein
MEYFTSDWHLGHNGVIQMANRPFSSTEDMNEKILDMVLTTTKKGDTLYHLGDLAFNSVSADKALHDIRKHGVKFHWVLGNHDHQLPIDFLSVYCETINGFEVIKKDGQQIHLSHMPCTVWTSSFRNSWSLYGHIHAGSFELAHMAEHQLGKSLCVNLEFHDYKMWTFEELKNVMEMKANNWDYEIYRQKGKYVDEI